jgi:hypothetical protein
VTLRRLAELLQVPGEALPTLRGLLRSQSPDAYLPPLWAVHPRAEELLALVGRDRPRASRYGDER